MNSPASMLQQILIGLPLPEVTDPEVSGEIQDWACFYSSMPDGKGIPDDCVALYDTTGVIRDALIEGYVQEFGLQMRVRARGYDDGWQKTDAICEQIQSLFHHIISAGGDQYKFQRVSQTSSIAALGPERDDPKRREIFTVNFLAFISKE